MDAELTACDGLIHNMNQIHDYIDLLIKSSQKKEELIIANNVDGLEELLIDEAEISSAIKQKEKELKHIALNIQRATNTKSKDFKLKEICCSISDAGYRQGLLTATDSMVAAIKHLNHQSDKLKDLLRQRIGYTDFMLNLLHSPQNRLHSYNVLGNQEESMGNFSVLDYHA